MSITSPDQSIARLLRLLAKGPAKITPAAKAGFLLADGGTGFAITIDTDNLQRSLEDGLIVQAGETIALSPSLSAATAKPGTTNETARGREGLAITRMDDGVAMVSVNLSESPLGQLYRRRDKRGRPYLDTAEFEAGERLRSDYSRACLLPNVTQNWSGLAGQRGAVGNGLETMSASIVSARKTVEAALDAVGPELAGPLVDICCFLKGLEQVEAERGWPIRSAKVMLKVALAALARHYTPESRPRMRHWGEDDYRPHKR